MIIVWQALKRQFSLFWDDLCFLYIGRFWYLTCICSLKINLIEFPEVLSVGAVILHEVPQCIRQFCILGEKSIFCFNVNRKFHFEAPKSLYRENKNHPKIN
jgi:hypothetical protein